jgi:hypothetical protein
MCNSVNGCNFVNSEFFRLVLLLIMTDRSSFIKHIMTLTAKLRTLHLHVLYTDHDFKRCRAAAHNLLVRCSRVATLALMRITWAGKLNLTAQLTTSQIAMAGASSRLGAYSCTDAVEFLKICDKLV